MGDWYVYYHCDQWKMRDSMDLVGVFDYNKLLEMVIEDVECGVVDADDLERDELIKMEPLEIEMILEFGHIKSIDLNERV